MQTQNSKGRQIFRGTDIQNLYLENLSILPLYRHAKFHVDMLRNGAIIGPFHFVVFPP